MKKSLIFYALTPVIGIALLNLSACTRENPNPPGRETPTSTEGQNTGAGGGASNETTPGAPGSAASPAPNEQQPGTSAATNQPGQPGTTSSETGGTANDNQGSPGYDTTTQPNSDQNQ